MNSEKTRSLGDVASVRIHCGDDEFSFEDLHCLIESDAVPDQFTNDLCETIIDTGHEKTSARNSKIGILLWRAVDLSGKFFSLRFNDLPARVVHEHLRDSPVTRRAGEI